MNHALSDPNMYVQPNQQQQPPVGGYMSQQQGYVEPQATQAQPAVDRNSQQLLSSGNSSLLKDVDLDQVEQLVQNNFNADVFDNISSEIKELRLDNPGAAPAGGAQRAGALNRQTSNLDTPDVSMEQGQKSTSSSSFKRNNLNKL